MAFYYNTYQPQAEMLERQWQNAPLVDVA